MAKVGTAAGDKTPPYESVPRYQGALEDDTGGPMALTNETLRELLQQYLGLDPGQDEIERLLPLVAKQMERMQALHALDLGGDHPRDTFYIVDYRLPPPAPEGTTTTGGAR